MDGKEVRLKAYEAAQNRDYLHGAMLRAFMTVHSLGAPSTLNTTLLNTNCIENPFRNVRVKIRRVSRWRTETHMASKWMAYALHEADAASGESTTTRIYSDWRKSWKVCDKRM
jgi:hypothetical protein